jgi:SAM-dependent methyltransferase
LIVSDPSQALSFGKAAAHYDRIRPSYPAPAVRWALGADQGTVVDLGAGTGLLTRAIAAIAKEVIPVEPDSGMRAQLAAATAGVTPLAGSAESIPLADTSVDAVMCGQAYHWFDFDRAHQEIARVLRSGGVFAPIWNLRDETVPWVAELSRLIEPDGTGAGHRWLDWTDATFGDLFGPVERKTFRHAVSMDAQRLLALVASRSHYLVATPATRAEIDARVRGLTAMMPAEFELPYVTVSYRATKR